MQVLLAPDKFKGSVSAQEVCTRLSAGIRSTCPAAEVVSLPLADGGEGSLDAVEAALPHVERQYVPTFNAAGDPWDTYYLHRGEEAWIEMAKASGWPGLKPQQRHPLRLSTFGTGWLVADALARGCRDLTIFCGGSATVDGGIGLAMALGYRFVDIQGAVLPAQAASLPAVERIIRPADLDLTRIKVKMAVDVFNPLTGPQGAALVYGPQKGATAEECQRLDRGLTHLRQQCQTWFGLDPGDIPGAGAAGGLGAGGVAFLGATVVSGAEYLMTLTNLAKKISSANLVITGEGKFDHQSLQGKLVWQIYQWTQRQKKSLIICCGINEVNQVIAGCTVMALTDLGFTPDEAQRQGPELLFRLGQKIGLKLMVK